MRGRALPEESSKSFCVCWEKKKEGVSFCLHDNRGTCRQELSCEGGLLWNVVIPPVQQHKVLCTMSCRSTSSFMGREEGIVVMWINPTVKGLPSSCLCYANGTFRRVSEQLGPIINKSCLANSFTESWNMLALFQTSDVVLHSCCILWIVSWWNVSIWFLHTCSPPPFWNKLWSVRHILWKLQFRNKTR